MEVTIKTLTPLWTGGVEAGKCDRIHETGILGSLRWWMEALVRGMGGNVCDPTKQECLYDLKKPNNNLCDVCQVFGATGWSRRFRLEVVQDNTQPNNTVTSAIQAERSNVKKGKPPTWYFPKDLKDKPRSGRFTLQIQSLHPGFKPEVLSGLIQFIADWSALGARPQMGFGVVQVEGSRIDTQSLYDWLVLTTGVNTYSSELPSLQNIFLAKIQPKGSNPPFNEENTFNLKYDLRKLFRTDTETYKRKDEDGKPRLKKKDEVKDLRHFIMGTVEDDRMAAKIKISRVYDDGKLMRVWGWVPSQAEVYKDDWNTEKIIDIVHQHLTANYNLHVWREMNAARDTVTSNQTDVQAFLRSLLQLQEDN